MERYDKGGNAAQRKTFQLEDIAQRIEPRASWEDLALPQATISQLKNICNKAGENHKILRKRGFDQQFSKGKGLNVLFCGPPGTAKTMASEVLAKTLGLDLYCIDLSRVVSKYIGETEKNLNRIFDIAECSGCILFFDEADALFGKRTEVSNAHDRYANIETEDLIRTMEERESIIILSTNLKQNIDEALIRRLRFIIDFPLPDDESRKSPWYRLWLWLMKRWRKS